MGGQLETYMKLMEYRRLNGGGNDLLLILKPHPFEVQHCSHMNQITYYFDDPHYCGLFDCMVVSISLKQSLVDIAFLFRTTYG